MRYLAIALALVASCGDDDSTTPDAPDDLVVDSDEIILDGDDIDSADIDGNGDISDVVMVDADGDFGLPDSEPIDAPQGTVFLSETDVDFGLREVGAPTVGRTLAVTNTSEFSVLILSVDVVGPAFALGGTTCGTELPAGASCDLVVTAAPEALGDQEGQLFIQTDLNTPFATLHAVGGRRITITRSGTGTGTISSNPPGISCGSMCSGVFPGSVSLSASAGGDSTFETWTGPCSGTGTCVIPPGTSPVTVGAQFALAGDASIRVAFSGSAAGAVAIRRNGAWLATCTSSCERTVDPGDTIEIKATSPVGFSGFAGCTSTGPQSCTLTAAAGASSVTATFAPPAGVAWTRLLPSAGHAVWDSSGDLVIAMSTGLVKLSGATGAQLSTVPRSAQFLEAGPSGTLVIITDSAVAKLSASGTVLWERPLPSALGIPNSLAVGADGSVAAHGSSSISRWAADGTPSWTMPRAYASPGGVAIGAMGIVIVPRDDAGTVHGRRYAAADGSDLPELTQIGTGRVAGGIGVATGGQIGTSFSSNGSVFTQLGSQTSVITELGAGPVANTASFSPQGHAAITAQHEVGSAWQARLLSPAAATLVSRSGRLLAPGIGILPSDAAAGAGARFALVGTYTDFAAGSDSNGATVGWVQAYAPSP